MPRILVLILLLAILGCGRNLTIRDVVITNRLFSPDGSYVAFTYYKDNGAIGQSSPMTSILKVKDTIGELNKTKLPCFDLPFYSCYYPDHWLDNKTLQVYLNERSFVKEGIPFDSTSFTINGIKCKVVPFDNSYISSPLIEYFSFSDDREKLLVAYRYGGDLNISAINYADKLPRIGNVFTNTENSFNPIQYVKWNRNGIDMFLTDAQMFEKSNYINKNNHYDVKFVDIKELKEPYKSNDNISFFPLFNDYRIDESLKTSGLPIKALIIESQWRKEGDKSLFYYQYEYEAAGQKYRSYFKIFKEFKNGAGYEKGDSIVIKYDPRQPLIHTTDQKYSR